MSTWPQWTMLALHTIALIYNANKDGVNRAGAVGTITTIIAFVAPMTILYYGGFWSVWGIAP